MHIQWMRMPSTRFILFHFYPYSESLALPQRAMLQTICQHWDAGSLWCLLNESVWVHDFCSPNSATSAWGPERCMYILGVSTTSSNLKVIELLVPPPLPGLALSVSNNSFVPNNINKYSWHVIDRSLPSPSQYADAMTTLPSFTGMPSRKCMDARELWPWYCMDVNSRGHIYSFFTKGPRKETSHREDSYILRLPLYYSRLFSEGKRKVRNGDRDQTVSSAVTRLLWQSPSPPLEVCKPTNTDTPANLPTTLGYEAT